MDYCWLYLDDIEVALMRPFEPFADADFENDVVVAVKDLEEPADCESFESYEDDNY